MKKVSFDCANWNLDVDTPDDYRRVQRLNPSDKVSKGK